MPVTFSGNVIPTRDGTITPKKSVKKGRGIYEAKQRKGGIEEVRQLQNQLKSGTINRGDKDVVNRLNQLERLGVNTFGVGLRGMFDYSGAGVKPVSRSFVSMARNTANDPSKQVFSPITGKNVYGMSIQDFGDYIQGRDKRVMSTPMGKFFSGIGNLLPGVSAAKNFQGIYNLAKRAGFDIPDFTPQNRVIPFSPYTGEPLYQGIQSLPPYARFSYDPKAIYSVDDPIAQQSNKPIMSNFLGKIGGLFANNSN